MSTVNIKASSCILFDKQFKFCDFVPEFSWFRTDEDKTRNGCQSIDDSLFVSRNGDEYFNPVVLGMLLKMVLIIEN